MAVALRGIIGLIPTHPFGTMDQCSVGICNNIDSYYSLVLWVSDRMICDALVPLNRLLKPLEDSFKGECALTSIANHQRHHFKALLERRPVCQLKNYMSENWALRRRNCESFVIESADNLGKDVALAIILYHAFRFAKLIPIPKKLEK